MRKLIRIVKLTTLGLGALAFVAACTTLATTVAKVSAFAMTDLVKAQSLATGAGDTISMSCYGELITDLTVLNAAESNPAGTPTLGGVFTNAEVVALLTAPGSPTTNKLLTNCGPLVARTVLGVTQFIQAIAALGAV
jgi:hypothetical protein